MEHFRIDGQMYKNIPTEIIEKYIDLLLAWNAKINLVSIQSREELIERHILDSLQLMKHLDSNQKIVDVGSGAGFPGLILSYAGIKEVNLVELNSKKANFLLIAGALSPNIVKVHNLSVEDLNITNCDIITARGLASLDSIFSLTQKIAHKNTKYLLLKGKNIEEEIKNALNKWNFKYILHPSDTSEEGRVLEVEQLKYNGQAS